MHQAAPAGMLLPGGMNQSRFGRTDAFYLLQTLGVFGDDSQGIGAKSRHQTTGQLRPNAGYGT